MLDSCRLKYKIFKQCPHISKYSFTISKCILVKCVNKLKNKGNRLDFKPHNLFMIYINSNINNAIINKL